MDAIICFRDIGSSISLRATIRKMREKQVVEFRKCIVTISMVFCKL